jgi:hypothetical protein
MIKFFKQLNSNIIEIKRLIEGLHIKKSPDFNELSIALMRAELGSIDHSDVDQEMTQDQREAYNAQVAACYESILLPTFKRFEREQEGFIARHAANERQSDFGRGTINGIDLLKEHFETAYKENKAAKQQPEPPSQPFNPLPEN